MKNIPLLLICVLAFSFATRGQSQCSAGFGKINWGMTVPDLKRLYPEQKFSKETNQLKQDVWVVRPVIMEGKEFSLAFTIGSDGDLRAFRFIRNARTIESDVFLNLGKVLDDKLGKAKIVDKREGDLIQLTGTYLSENSNIKLEMFAILGKSYLTTLSFEPNGEC